MNIKKTLIILINCICLWLTFKIIIDYYTKSQIKQTEKPIECTITEKDCKYSRATSHCNLLFEGKVYRVPVNNCDNLKIGNNRTDFYYNKMFENVFFKDYLEIKFLVAMPLMFILVLFFTAKNWKKI